MHTTNVALADYLPSGGGGKVGWQSADIATERSDGGNGGCLPYHLSFNLLDGGGSADIMEHYRPSKVSNRSEAEDADRSLPYNQSVKAEWPERVREPEQVCGRSF